LLSSVFDDISFCIVDEAKTEEQPDGDLFMAWKGLMDMFELSTPSTRLALKKEFQNSKLTSVDADPDVWITELELLRKRLKSLKVEIEDEDFVMQLINNFPMEYDSLVKAVEEDMNKGLEDQVTVKRVWERIRARFRRMTMRLDEGNSNNNRNEVALVIPPGQFKGMYHLCGKCGHKKKDCKENQNNRPNKKSYKDHNGTTRNSQSFNGTSRNSQSYNGPSKHSK
jgi:gag-polypeptide of LTR copia-type